MTKVFHARPYGRSKEPESNLRRKKLKRTSIFLDAVLAIEIMKEPQSNLEEKNNPSNFKR